jgi:hypothetical protein
VGVFPRNAHIYGLAGHFVAKSIFLFFGEGLKRQLPLVFGRVPGGGKGWRKEDYGHVVAAGFVDDGGGV